MDRIDRWCLGFLFVLVFVLLGLVIAGLLKIDERVELLEAEPQELRIAPVSGQRDEIERKHVREEFQEECRE